MTADVIAAISGPLTAVGGLAALVCLVTQRTKNLGRLARVPTDAQVIATALLLAAAATLAWAERAGMGFSWHLAAGALIWGLLAAFVAMYGWATFFDLLERFFPAKGGESHE